MAKNLKTSVGQPAAPKAWYEPAFFDWSALGVSIPCFSFADFSGQSRGTA